VLTAVGLMATYASLSAGLAQDERADSQKPMPREIEVTVPGEWKSRPTAKDKEKWVTQKTPSKVTIQPG